MSDLRVGGLVSGLDTQSILKELLKIDQNKVGRQYQQRQILEWQRDEFRAVNTKLLSLKNTLFDMKLSNTYNGKSVTSSNTDYLTATANSEAIPGIYDITVKQTATRAALSSQEALGSNGDKSSLSTQFTGLSSDTDINFSIKGKNGTMCFSAKAGNVSMQDLVRTVNDSNIGVKAQYDENADRFFLMSTEYGQDASIKVKVDGAGAGKGFLEDYLKLNIGYSGSNTEPATLERTIGSSSTIVIPGSSPQQYAALDTQLNQLYAVGEIVPTNITFTLEGSRGSYNFSVANTQTVEGLVTAINNQTANTGLSAIYSAADGVFILYEDMAPAAAVASGATAEAVQINFNEELYDSSSTAITDGADLLADFDYIPADGSSGSLTSATYNLADNSVAFAVSTPSIGDKIVAKSDTLYNADGKVHQPQTLTWDGTQWTISPIEPKVAIRADAQNFLAKKLNISMDEAVGRNAIIDFNGSPDIEFDSNQFTLADIDFNLNSSTPANTNLSITVEADINGAVDKIKSFVEKYNEIIEYLNTKTTEKRYRDYKNKQNDYPPLTTEQKAEMNEKEIELWETKAKSGLLRNDSLLRSITLELRMITTGVIQDQAAQKLSSGQRKYIQDEYDLIYYRSTDPDTGQQVTQTRTSYLSLESIGINTMAYASKSADNGKLIINETKLREALQTNPDDVSKLFTLTQTEVVEDEQGRIISTTEKNAGIAMRLYDNLTKGIADITSKAGASNAAIDSSLLSQNIARVDLHIGTLLDRMQTNENRYWKQFIAMEKAIQRTTEQGNWLAARLSEMQ